MPPRREERACLAKELCRGEVKGGFRGKEVEKRSLKDLESSAERVVMREAGC